MLYVRDKGQMCNNILQYAHMYAWGREHNRETMSMRFAYKYDYFHICHTKYHNFFRYVFAKQAAKLGLLPVITFPFEKGEDTSSQEAKMLVCKNAVVEGWRVEFFDLFLKYRSEIVKLFSFNDSVEQTVLRKMSRYCGACAGEDTVNLGVHIRRGDYSRFYGGKYFYDDDTFIRIIRQFVGLQEGRKVRVFICGNDPNIQKDRYVSELPGISVFFPEGSPGEDLCLLSKCDSLIGPPSTFSLVAAMYRDVPLYWILDGNVPLMKDSFKYFSELFRNIL